MKHFILILTLLLGVFIASAQTTAIRKSANYEAANWKPRLIDNPQQIIIAPPPGATQSKAELQIVKKAISQLDEKKLAEIKYWDAGAPSYRWKLYTGVNA